ncbi:hypothetical protein [Nocardia tenerifensis]|nr:hypothetical protein [Nocardia tenerifensis]
MKILLGTAAAAGLSASLIFTGLATAETPQTGRFPTVNQPGPESPPAPGAGTQADPQGGAQAPGATYQGGQADPQGGAAQGGGQTNPQGGTAQGGQTPGASAQGGAQADQQGGAALGGLQLPPLPGGLKLPGMPGAQGAPGGTADAPSMPNLGKLFGFGG